MTKKHPYTSKNDYRRFIKEGYDYYVCTKCSSTIFILLDTSDSIFPEIVCAKCGNIYQQLKQNPLSEE